MKWSTQITGYPQKKGVKDFPIAHARKDSTNILFEPIKINKMELKNRFVRSATQDGYSSEDGRITERTIKLYTKLAEGGVGLIISGHAYVLKNGQCFRFQNAIHNDDFIPSLKRLTDKVHEYHTKIALQLNHGGIKSRYTSTKGEIPPAPSLVKDGHYSGFKHREMDIEEIWEIINAFGEAARRGKEAGFDAIQFHGAHGYLFSQFLSPYTNRRNDEWGGRLLNRMRFHMEVYRSVRKAVGEDFPVMIKLGVKDINVKGGLLLSEGCEVAKRLSDIGMDAIEVSHGDHEDELILPPREKEPYYLHWAKKVKKVIAVPLILVGGIRSFDICHKIVQNGYVDCISMCRSFIREPHLINRWREKDQKRAKCISCDLCLQRIYEDKTVLCVQEMRLKAKSLS